MFLWLKELQPEVREDRGFEQLYELVDLDEQVDRDFEFRAASRISTRLSGTKRGGQTISVTD